MSCRAPVAAREDCGVTEHEVVLHAERPVLRIETVPVGGVRVGKHTVAEQQQVAGQVAKEQIELDTDPDVATDRHAPDRQDPH